MSAVFDLGVVNPDHPEFSEFRIAATPVSGRKMGRERNHNEGVRRNRGESSAFSCP